MGGRSLQTHEQVELFLIKTAIFYNRDYFSTSVFVKSYFIFFEKIHAEGFPAKSGQNTAIHVDMLWGSFRHRHVASFCCRWDILNQIFRDFLSCQLRTQPLPFFVIIWLAVAHGQPIALKAGRHPSSETSVGLPREQTVRAAQPRAISTIL